MGQFHSFLSDEAVIVGQAGGRIKKKQGLEGSKGDYGKGLVEVLVGWEGEQLSPTDDRMAC